MNLQAIAHGALRLAGQFGLPLSLSLLAGAVPAATPPGAQVFDAVKQPEKVDPQWRPALCALLPQPCSQESVQLLRPRGGAVGEFRLIAEQPLALARVDRDAASGRWRLVTLHDFSGYKHSAQEGERDDRQRLSLAPALYPLGEGRWAAAVLLTVSEMYSGGGASFSKADFVPLDDAAHVATAKPAQAGIPFNCSKMIRACFSEKEYRTSAHCHDESEGSLRITYSQGASAGAPYRWQYLWRETEWPSGQPARAATTVSSRFEARDADKVSWCGGPM